ncbi:MAG: 8-amino-7-oxononanoate synthase [Gammaproteobacteria bacterium]|nr:8-amino-7-oxononanoate synthase [Gammaproteobacteria bacterium]NBT43844.1 8-amino-7-oxononanoate synthase [Gammaproteobacteria bacterium]NBY23649.1 8-amino-7-oxononanoate synthase [Gammaproteobacteria bacterium]
MSAAEGLSERLKEIDSQGLTRRRKMLSTPQGVSVILEGRPLLNFCSNDYLGLANHPRVVDALRRGASEFGVGSGASHLVCGHSLPHQELEEALAAFTHRDRALLFSTGYMANLGVIDALVGRAGTIFEDRLNHASLLDGARLSGAKLKRYPHGSVPLLSSGEGQLIVSDGVFSMDGDTADVMGLSAVALKAGALLMIDDAHGLGVLGETGAGLLESLALGQGEVPILMGTLGKAFGTFGAFVAGHKDLIDYLLQRARTAIYTTALPPALAVATMASLTLIQEEGWRREHLRGLIERLRQGATDLHLPLMASRSPIQPFLCGSPLVATALADQLLDRGFLVTAIRPPTVPRGTARLRVTLTAGHTHDQVDALLEALSDGFRALPSSLVEDPRP